MKGLVLTYLVTLGASIGALRKPVIGLYAYVAFAVLRPQFIFGWAGDLSHISFVLGVSLLIGWGLNGFGSWRAGRAKPIICALFAYTSVYAISAFMAEFTDASYPALIELLKVVLPICVGVTMLDTEADWRPLLWVITLAQGYVAFEMNLNYLLGHNTAAEGFGGMDNNCFGVALVTVFGLAFALVLTSRRWLERAASAVASALILHTILLTYSRGALVGAATVMITAFIALPKRPKYIAVIVVALLVGLRFTGPELLERYSTILAPSQSRDSSAQSRLDLWKDTLTVIGQHPILGVGPANWRRISSRFGWTEGKSAHSVWMETAAEVGVPGTVALFGFFWLAVVRLWSLARERVTDENRYRVGGAIGVVLAAAGFISSGQFVSVVGLEAPYYVVMIGIALLRNGAAVTTVSSVQDRFVTVSAGQPASIAVVLQPQLVSTRIQSGSRTRLIPPLPR